MKKVLGVIFIALALTVALTSCTKGNSSEQFSEVIDNMSIESQESVNYVNSEYLIKGNGNMIVVEEYEVSGVFIGDDTAILVEVNYDDLFLSDKIGIRSIEISYTTGTQEYNIRLESKDNDNYKTNYTEDELANIMSKLSANDILDMLKSKKIIFTLE